MERTNFAFMFSESFVCAIDSYVKSIQPDKYEGSGYDTLPYKTLRALHGLYFYLNLDKYCCFVRCDY